MALWACFFHMPRGLLSLALALAAAWDCWRDFFGVICSLGADRSIRWRVIFAPVHLGHLPI